MTRAVAGLPWVLLIVSIATAIAATVLILTNRAVVRKEMSPQPIRRWADIPPEAWSQLCGKTIFFGHQSVGYDIVSGIRDIVASHEYLGLRIVETKDAKRVDGPALVHAPIGQNLHAESKTAEFTRLMEGGLAEKVDMAFFKFCFVDINESSNPDALFATYCKAMDTLKLRFPHTTFMHVTAPLCGPPTRGVGIMKTSIQRLLGRPTVLDENEVRNRYNALLRERFSRKEPLFDLALYETLGPEGLRHYSLQNGHEIPILAPMYTDDGGHLNARGQRYVAEQLLIQLLEVAGGSR